MTVTVPDTIMPGGAFPVAMSQDIARPSGQSLEASLVSTPQTFETTDTTPKMYVVDEAGRVVLELPDPRFPGLMAAVATNTAGLALASGSGVFESTDTSGAIYILDVGGRIAATLPDPAVAKLVASAATGTIFETTDASIGAIVVDPSGRVVALLPSQAAVAAATPTTVAEVVTARGNMPSLDARLSLAITADGAPIVDRYGRSRLRRLRYMLAKRALPVPEAIQIVINLFGDSYTHNASRWSGPFMDVLVAKYGDAGGGWCGFGGLPAGNAAPWYITRFTASIAGTTMTVTAIDSLSTPLAGGQQVNGTGVAGGTTIVNQIDGTPGGIGTYAVNNSQAVGSRVLNGSNQPSYTNGSVRPNTYPTRLFGNVVQAYYNQPSPDLAMATLAQAGDKVFQGFPALPVHDGCDLHFFGTADGVIQYSWGTYKGSGSIVEPSSYTFAAPVQLAVQGTLATSQIADIKAGMPAGQGGLLVDWIAGTAKVPGVNLKSSAPGVRINKLAATGSNIGQWANAPAAQWEAALAALGGHAGILMDGTNSQGSSMSPTAWGANVATIVGRIRAANPGLDVLLATPPENQRTTNTVPMSAYATEGRKRAASLRLAFLDLQPAFGDPSNPGEYAWNGSVPLFANEVPAGIHPEPLTGGRAMVAEFLDFVIPF